MSRPRATTPPDLAEILSARDAGMPAPERWSAADRALYAGTYGDAARLYAAASSTSPRERAKHGFCLGIEGNDDAAEELLSEENVGSHPEALAVLAWVLGGTWGRRMSAGFGSSVSAQRANDRRARVEALLMTAMAAERPTRMVFSALFEIFGNHSEKAREAAERARMLYPNWALPHAILATKRRISGEIAPAILDDLMRTLPTARCEQAFSEAYVYAMELGRWADVERVVDTLEGLVRQDEQTGGDNLAALAEMRAMLSLHRARAGEFDGYDAVERQLAEFFPTAEPIADGRDPTVVSRFLLQVSLETRQRERIKASATMLVEHAWELHGSSGEDLSSWGPMISTPSMEGVLRIGNFGFDFRDRSAEVEATLDGAVLTRWRVLLAADAALYLEPGPRDVELLRSTPVANVPRWIARVIFRAHVDHAPDDPAAAGAVLAELSERAAALPPPEDPRFPTLLEDLEVDFGGLEDPVVFFAGAYSWLCDHPAATGEALLQEWGEDLAAIDGGKEVLARLARLSLSRVESAIARSMLALASEPDMQEDPLAAALSRYPQPETTRVRAADLSLLEAATLTALLRACELDHLNWTLAPMASTGREFEPTRKFIGTLFNLMGKGVIAVDLSTPAGVVSIGENGLLRAYLARVVWRVSAHTLALQREIRDLQRGCWPQSWRDHAPVLARDLGVEELVVYLDHLLRERDLPTPDFDRLRGVFRSQLEHLAIAQCYYLAHKTALSTLEYKAQHHPGRPQLEGRVVNLLRSNGERMIELGWSTRYRRVNELPASLLWEALHDVLTGWGNAAFVEPLNNLTLDDS